MNKYKKLVSNTLIFAIGSFGSKILLLLLTRLYTGNINPGDNSTKELLEQTANFLIPIITFSIADAVIRYGIDKNFDNRKIFTSACVTEAFGIGVLLLLSAKIAGKRCDSGALRSFCCFSQRENQLPVTRLSCQFSQFFPQVSPLPLQFLYKVLEYCRRNL